jgi:PAS domain S-box-containing protein
MDEPSREALRREAQRLEMATRAAGMGLWERDLEGSTTYWDAQMYRLHGFGTDDPRPCGKLAWLSTHPEDRDGLIARTRLHVNRGQPYEREFRVVWPDGSVRWIASVGMAVRDACGRPTHMTGASWDITERRMAERALREQEAAERASREKSRFLARMSHELRTPLNAVLGFAQLVEGDGERPLAAAQRERLGRIRSAGSHLLSLIEDVLDLSSIESGTLAMTLEPVSLDAAMDDVRRWVAPRAKALDVSIHAPASGAWVLADARRLRQVLVNLLTNAIKYNRPGGVARVSASPRRRDAAACWQITVSDTGRGIDPAQHAHLFEPFNRLGAEREGIEGVGIGLAIVRHLLDLMGGAIEVASEQGVGSEFRLLLQCAQPAGASVAAGRAARVSEAPVRAREALSILYVEDNPVNSLLVEQILAGRPDMRLRCAPDGLRGVEMALADPPDVLLVDMQLPDIDGAEVLRRLRAQAPLAGARFIALSANALADDIAQARAAGFDDYWTKPVDVPRFLGGLEAVAAARVDTSTA